MQRPCAPKARRPTFGPLCIRPTILPFLCSCPFLVSIFTVGLCVLWVLCGPSKATARCYTSICDGIIFHNGIVLRRWEEDNYTGFLKPTSFCYDCGKAWDIMHTITMYVYEIEKRPVVLLDIQGIDLSHGLHQGSLHTIQDPYNIICLIFWTSSIKPLSLNLTKSEIWMCNDSPWLY